jgi:hypothetical protein
MTTNGVKLRLEMDELEVESFEMHGVSPSRGTVKGHATQYGTCQRSCVQTCGGPTCEPPCEYDPTYYVTCVESCGWTDGVNVCIGC